MNFFRLSAQYIFLSLLGLGALFFAFPNSSEAACQVNIDSFNFRSGGDKGTDWFDEENLPTVYVDFQTSNCQSGDQLHLTIFGIPPTPIVPGFGGTVAIRSSVFPINTGSLINQGGSGSVGLNPGENTCFDDNDGSSVDNGRECLIFAMMTDLHPTNPNANIIALEGNLIGAIPLNQAQFFANFYNAGTNTDTTPGCAPSNQYLFRTHVTCSSSYLGYYSGLFGGSNTINQKLIDFYSIINFGNQGTFPFSLTTEQAGDASTVGFPALTYDCDWDCEEDDSQWQTIQGGGLLPYGETSPYDDTQTIVPSALPEVYQENYVPLAPLPFEGLNGGATPDLGSYLAAIFRTGIVIAIILAVLMIVFHGIAYATTGAIQKKDDHREGVWNAIMGLLIALGAWLLLNTVSPRLASELSIGIPEVSLDGYEYSGPGVASIPTDGSCGPQQTPACPSCQPIEGGIQLKPEVAVPGHNTISQSTLQKLYNMQNTLNANAISWRVTEAFSPTYMQHCSQCHYNGSCIDANFTSTDPTPQNIESFVQAAAAAGLRAVYETNSQSTIDQIQAETDLQPSTKGGTGNYLLLNGITAPHFSVYNQ